MNTTSAPAHRSLSTVRAAAGAIERRFTAGAVELRQAGEGDGAVRKVHGYAAMFGKRSSNLGSDTVQFFEIIEPGAFTDVLLDDVRALFNHDANLILARSKAGAGSLTLGQDATGLWYEFEAPDTQAGRDLMVSLTRGDIDQSSFAFTLTPEGEKWEEVREGDQTIILRTIKKVSRLYDVSPVTYPAYPDATAALRSLEQFKAQPQTPEPKPETLSPSDNPFPMRSLWAARLGFPV